MMNILRVGCWLTTMILVGSCAWSGGKEPVRCWIESPQVSATLSGTAEITVGVEGPALSVELWLGGQMVASAEVPEGAAEVSLAWDTTRNADGDYLLKVRALFRDGREVWSEPINVILENVSVVGEVAFGPALPRLSILQGEVLIPFSIDVTSVERIRLLLDLGSRELFSSTESVDEYRWDTQTTTDGCHVLHLEVTDTANNVLGAELPVVVANRGQEAEVTYLSGQELTIPEDYQSTDFHVRVSIPAQQNVRGIISWITFEPDPQNPWEIEYAIGQGLCPHRGIKYAAETSTRGEILIALERSELPSEVVDRFPAGDQQSDVFPYNTDPLTFGAFFGHVNLINPEDHVGQTLPFEAHYVLLFGP